MTDFRCDKQWFRLRNGRGVLAGSPLTQFTVTEKGAAILDALEHNELLPQGHEPLTSRLLAKGAIHPVVTKPIDASLVTVVVPTHITHSDQLERLQRLIHSLAHLTVIVVDDASPIHVNVTGARVIRQDTNKGPGAARNTGLTCVETPFVVFIDDDVSTTHDDVLILAQHLEDKNVAFVAPRVQSGDGDGILHDYELVRSSLDLGNSPAVVRPGSRVSYVPSAYLAASVNTLQGLGGFDESLRVGEDVDLIWRAVEKGLLCRYDPAIICRHLPRQSVVQFLRQRFSYGSSSAALDARHPFAATPLRTHVLLVIPPILLLSGFVLWAFYSTLVAIGWFMFSLRTTRLSLKNRLRVIGIGFSSTVQLFMTAVARTWWPLFLVGSVFYAPALLLYVLSVLVPPLRDLITKRPQHPSTFVVLHILENFSYGLGVWKGVAQQRSVRCLLPALTFRSGRLRSKV